MPTCLASLAHAFGVFSPFQRARTEDQDVEVERRRDALARSPSLPPSLASLGYGCVRALMVCLGEIEWR